MVQTTSIKESDQGGVLSSFWMMLQELDVQAECSGSALLRHQVAQWYGQWNQITGDSQKPRHLRDNPPPAPVYTSGFREPNLVYETGCDDTGFNAKVYARDGGFSVVVFDADGDVKNSRCQEGFAAVHEAIEHADTGVLRTAEQPRG